MIYNQMVTWTAFAILAMFLTVPPKMDKALINLKLNFLEKKIGMSGSTNSRWW